MVRLVHVIFMDGTVLGEIAWAMMVLLQKGKGGYRGIGIVEVLCQVYSVLVNCSLNSSFVLHDALHEFREWRGAGMATLEANLAQQLASIAHDTLFQVFLDVHNSYSELDRER